MASLEGWNFTIKLCPRDGISWRSAPGMPSPFWYRKKRRPGGSPFLVCIQPPLLFRSMAASYWRMIKLIASSGLLCLSLVISARADLTIVQKVEGAGPVADMTIKIKGDKARIDATPQISTIMDGKTGEMINLMNDQKTAVHVSAEKMKAAAAMVSKFDDENKTAEKPKLTSTGKKETVNGYEAEEYVYETPDLKATYWIASKYPDGAAILKEMQSLKSEAWSASNAKMPDYHDFPGVPIKTVISMGGNQMTSTITSIKKDPLNDADFSVPKDFREIKTPEIKNLPQENVKESSPESSPKP
jgi:Domain of unknown function (DUF4412)